MNENASNPTLTIADVARMYNVHISTVYRRIKDGTLPSYKLGHRTVRLDAAEVRAAFMHK